MKIEAACMLFQVIYAKGEKLGECWCALPNKLASPRGRVRYWPFADLLLLNIVASLFMGCGQWVSDALDDDDLQLARAVLLAVRRGLKVLGRFVAGDRLLEARELDDDEAVEFLRALEDLELAAARQELAAELLRGCLVPGRCTSCTDRDC